MVSFYLSTSVLHFCSTVSKNVRVAFVVSSGGVQFQHIARSFPSLLMASNMIWLEQWNRSMLIEHADYRLQGVQWIDKSQRENLCHLLASMHMALRQADGTATGSHGHLTNTTFQFFIEKFVPTYTCSKNECVPICFCF